MFHCSVVTPERAVLECDARQVIFPAHDGQVGILTHRAPLLSRLGIGALRVDAEDGGQRVFVIDGGFAQMVDNRLTILTEQARESTEIDRMASQAALEAAMRREAHGEREQAERQRDIKRARIELKVAK